VSGAVLAGVPDEPLPWELLAGLLTDDWLPAVLLAAVLLAPVLAAAAW
jgi:hypothetical protein